MRLVLDRETRFTPGWGGNAKESEPIVFRLRYLTTLERQRLAGLRAMASLVQAGVNGKGTDAGSIDLDFEGMFKAAVIGVDTLTVRVEGSDRDEAVTTPEALLALPSLDGLFQEVAMHIATMNARQDPKN